MESRKNLLSHEYDRTSREDIEFLPLPTSEYDEGSVSPTPDGEGSFVYTNSQARILGEEEEEETDKKIGKDVFKDRLSFGLSVFNLMNVILGSGILGLAEVVQNLGVISFTILLICTCILAAYQINLLLHSSEIAEVKTYEGLAFKSFKLKGKILASTMIVLHCLSSMISYIYIIKNEFPEVLKAISGYESQSEEVPIYFNGSFLAAMVLIFVIGPLSMLKDIRFLGYSSAFGMFCMIFFTITVIIKKFSIPCPLDTNQLGKNQTEFLSSTLEIEGNQTCQVEYFTITPRSAYALPTMAFAFMCHASMLPIYAELRRPTIKRMQRVANLSIFNIFTLYFCTAVFGYLTFFNRVQSELLLSYSLYNSNDILVIIARMMVIICLMFSVPLLHFPARKTIILTVFNDPLTFSWLRHIGVTIGNLTLCALLVFFVPNIRDIFGFSGATSSMALLIVLPCAFFIKLSEEKKEKYKTRRIVAWVFAIFGVLFAIFSTILIVLDWLS